MKEFGLAFLICLVFIGAFSFVPASWYSGGDYFVHFVSAKYSDCYIPPVWYDTVSEPKFLVNCINQPFLFKSFASFFTDKDQTFWFFTLILTGLLIPLGLFLLTKKSVTVWFYFTISSFFYYHINGFQTQATMAFIFVLMLYSKNNYARLLLLVLASLSHSQGFFLGVLTLSVLLFFENKEQLKDAFLGCSTVWGFNSPKFLKTGVNVDNFTNKLPVYSLNEKLTVGTFLVLFFKIFPFVFFFPAFFELWKKNKAFFYLGLGVLLTGLFLSERILYFLVPLLLVGFTSFYSRLSKRWKLCFLGLSVVWLFFNLWTFYNLHVVCKGGI